MDRINQWRESNRDAEAEESAAKQKELEDVFNPIMTRVYQQAGGATEGGDHQHYDHTASAGSGNKSHVDEVD